MRDVSAKMDALYQRMQELHNGAVARDAYVNGKLDAQYQRSDHHRGKLNFLACDRVELEYESDSSYHLVPIASNCLSCAAPPAPENEEPIPMPPPDSESENIDP